LTNITSDQVIGKMKNIFARWGVPETLVTDNGTQFTSQSFESLAHDYNFRQTFSSPHYPQANGEAERAVKIAKLILRQETTFFMH
jgi:transposase InsO family protein